MKVWTKVVIEPDGTINKEESSWEQYEGPLALADGGDDDVVPEISAEERALQAQQADLLKFTTASLKEQAGFQKELQPFLLEQMGIERNEAGELIKTDDPAQDLREKLELASLERTQQAFEGKLPVSPALERGIERQQQVLEETLRKSVGRDSASSSIGTERLGDFFTRAEELREGARRGQIQGGIGQSIALGGAARDDLTRFLGGAQSVSQGSLPFIGAGTSMSRALGQAQTPFFNQRTLQTQANLRPSTMSQLFGAAGQIGGGIASSVAMGQALRGDDLFGLIPTKTS